MVIKEFCPSQNGTRVVLRENNYGSSLAKFQRLFAQAKQDFPDLDLKEEDTEIVQYGGDRIKRQWGLEFNVPSEHKIPAGYLRLDELEYTL